MNQEGYQTPPRPNRNIQPSPQQTQIGPSSRLVRALDVARKVKSFDHFLYVWGSKGGYYLPPKSALTWHYVSQVLAGEKRLLRVEAVGHALEIPKFKGLLVRDIWEHCKTVNDLHLYLPDITAQTQVPRTYFFNVN